MNSDGFVTISFTVLLAGILSGLIVRILREGVELKFALRVFIMSLKFFIIYPLTVPFIIFVNKNNFAQFFAEEIVKVGKVDKDNDIQNVNQEYVIEKTNSKINGADKKRVQEIKKEILKDLTLLRIFMFWIMLLRHASKNYDAFVRSNIKVCYNLVLEKEKNSSRKRKKNNKNNRPFCFTCTNNGALYGLASLMRDKDFKGFRERYT